MPLREPFGKYQPMFYDVVGLPPNRMIMICRRMVPIEPACWQILPTTLWDDGDKGVRGQPTGAYESPEAALAAIDDAFLQNPEHWVDLREGWFDLPEPGSH